MKIIELKARRRDTGKGASRKLRTVGEIPAVLYGEGIESYPLAVDVRDFIHLIRSEGLNVIVKLKVEGDRGDPSRPPRRVGVDRKDCTAIIKEIQRDPLKDFYLHIDFQKIAMDEKISTMVPITIVGEAPGVKEGGVLQHGLWEVEVEALPKDLPDCIEVDVSALGIGDAVRVSDLPKPEGVEILTSPDEVLVSIVPPTAIVKEVAEEEEVEEEVPAEAEMVKEEEKKEGKKEE
ncbi:MAG: 50S ribosomal protein L25 [Actinomycetota bacterium]|nr:50S ribosomal protein L25 [Actinomycetota bacterium]